MSDKLTILNGRLRVDTCGGPLVLSPKPGGSEPCCCGCKTCFKFKRDRFGSTTPGDIDWRQTFTAPIDLTPPYSVNVDGSVDDVLLKDGQPWPPGTDPNAPAYGFNYTWTENNPSFELAAKDTKGGNIRIDVTVCFMPLNNDPATTTPCAPTVTL
jgi:hypothetical protein